MAESSSLNEFYAKSMSAEYAGFDYPFGLWYFGSIVMKITGLTVYQIAYLVPLLILVISLVVFYCYGLSLMETSHEAIFALILLVSMPMMAISFMNYSPNIFSIFLLVAIVMLAIKATSWAERFLLAFFIFCLAVTHTGTFLFLITFAIAYFLIYALIWKKFDTNFYFLIVMMLILYVSAVAIFPFVQEQYIYKGTIILSTTASLSSALKMPLFEDLGTIFYNSIFLTNNYAFILLWSGLLFTAGKLCIFFRTKIFRVEENAYFAVIPFLGGVKNISHSITMTPFWIGPIHTLLSIIGLFRINSKGKCIALSLVFTSLIPGALGGAEGTGALREISYLILIVPLLASIGFFCVTSHVNKYCSRKNTRLEKTVTILLYTLIFASLIIAPIIGTLYYQPKITMTREEESGLLWLGSVGTPLEGASGNVYRERMTMYANKTVPSIPAGTETKRFSKDLMQTYFYSGSEDFTKDLNSYQVQYLIASDRAMKSYSLPKESLKIDTNKEVDKIYDSGSFFSIYRITDQPAAEYSEITVPVYWIMPDETTDMESVGSIFLYENNNYKIKFGNSAPEIRYFGSPTKNFIDEGEFSDKIYLVWRYQGNKSTITTEIDPNLLKYSSIHVGNNIIIYKANLTDDAENQSLGSLEIKYSLMEKAVKKEIRVSNDAINYNKTKDLDAIIATTVFCPMQSFEYHLFEEDNDKWVTKKIYPSADSIRFKDILFNEMYFQGNDIGMYLRFDESQPYPTNLLYGGLIDYDIANVGVSSGYQIMPGDSAYSVQYFSIGDKQTASQNIDQYQSVSLSPFPNGEIPLVLIGLAEGQNLTDFEKTGFTTFQQKGLIYNLILRKEQTGLKNVLPSNVRLIGYMNAYQNKSYKSFEIQKKEIYEAASVVRTNSIANPMADYNIDSILALKDNEITDFTGIGVTAPDKEKNRQGLRNLHFMYLEGKRTDMILVPVTLPRSSILDPEYDIPDTYSQWNATIQSVPTDGGLAVLFWNMQEIGNPEYSGNMFDLINLALQKGYTIKGLEDLTGHFRSIQNVSAAVVPDVDAVNMVVINQNSIPVKGVTYRVMLPAIGGKCEYSIVNGINVRSDLRDQSCILYVSVDFDGFEKKEISIKPAGSRIQFSHDLPLLFQGTNYITVRDYLGVPVHNATILVDTTSYETDQDGIVKINLYRGNHSISFTKPGYEKVDFKVSAGGRFTKYMNYLYQLFS
jgi:hypothetical protein